MPKRLPKKGDRVLFTPLRIKGTIRYIDYQTLFVPYLYPIQIELDEPWDPESSVVRMIRANLKEIRRLRRKMRK